MQKRNNSHTNIQKEFWRRLGVEWLPPYCNDPRRRYSIDGFNVGAKGVSTEDARDFMRALDHKVVTDVGGGRYRLPQSRATEHLFWEGSVTAVTAASLR